MTDREIKKSDGNVVVTSNPEDRNWLNYDEFKTHGYVDINARMPDFAVVEELPNHTKRLDIYSVFETSYTLNGVNELVFDFAMMVLNGEITFEDDWSTMNYHQTEIYVMFKSKKDASKFILQISPLMADHQVSLD